MASDYLKLYEDYLREEKHASENTLSSYLRDLRQFSEHLAAQRVTDLRKVKTAAISDYVAWMGGKGKSAATVTRALASIKSFYAFLAERGEIKTNPAKGVAALKVERRFPEILTGKEVELFLDQPRCVDAKGYRDHAMLELLYATGIRVSELQYITVQAVRAGRAEIANKGKHRIVFLPAKLCRLLGKYLHKQHITAGAVFVTRTGKPLDRSNIWREMKALCESAGVEPGKVFPHSLRHLFARTYYSLEKDLSRLADILGHSSVSTTRIYTAESGHVHARQLERLGLIIT